MTNPIASLAGTDFLVFYAIVIAITAAFCWWRRWKNDATSFMRPLLTPTQLDPYEVAFLRGGENELTRVAVVRLVAGGYLQLEQAAHGLFKTKEQRIVHAPAHPTVRGLSQLERYVFDWFRPGRTIEEEFASAELPAMLRSQMAPLDEQLHAEHLLASDAVRARGKMTALIGAAVVGALGGWRLVLGLLNDRPVGFLVFMGIAGIAVVASCAESGRLSSRGRAYLKAMQREWGHLRSPGQNDMALAASLFGIGVLAGTPFSFLADAFKKSQATGDAGCGSACGDGGGCGGCGGCG